MTEELSKTYDPTQFEDDLYKWWLEKGYFKPETQEELGIVDEKSERFCNTIPPPNVTGVLHLGHAMTISLQDLMVRHARMAGRKTLFLPGADHAGIATQNVVERELNKKGIKRKELGREKFLEEVWKWKEKSHSIITQQSMKMGLSADWDRERFTMDEMLSKAVREAFVTLFERGLIYRGSYLINWCPGRCESAISDLEAIPEEVEGKLYTIKYPIKTKSWSEPRGEWGSGTWAKGARSFIVVATTRPETLLGDSGVAIPENHPKFSKHKGKTAILPVLGREIPIFVDEYVDASFGTGAVKITPAHDFNDYEIGKRHNLKHYTVLDAKSVIIEEFGGKYAGMDRFKAREEIVKDLEKEGLLVEVEDYVHNVPHCERCHTIVEPRDSTQWFVKTRPLVEKVLAKIEEEGINFIPPKMIERLYHWLNPETIKDWCISRQLWWGHRIPVWYCDDCEEITTGREDPTKCSSCGSRNIHQDEDVLDTWFSSGLWPFSTMGWPNDTRDMEDFFPNTMRETGYDILFFWVARELMMSVELTGKLPYRNVYFHGLVRNEAGKKISKSMENIQEYDPLTIIPKYGADSLRFTLVSYSSPGLDMNLDPKNLDGVHKFGNKIWQATRFALSKVDASFQYEKPDLKKHKLSFADRWILSEVNSLVKFVSDSVDNYSFLEAAREIRRFFWNSFADWYIEISKLRTYSDEDYEEIDPRHILVYVLDRVFRLLHPFMPFITEKLWQQLPAGVKDEGALIIAKWPKVEREFIVAEASENFELFKEATKGIRRIRGEFNVPYSTPMTVLISAGDRTDTLEAARNELIYLTKIDGESLKIEKTLEPPKKSISVVLDGVSIYIPLEGLIEIEAEVSRVKNEIDKLEKQITKIDAKLSSEFATRAPAELVEKEKNKRNELRDKQTSLVERLELLES